MMSIAKLNAGNGYQYYVRETASMDTTREGQKLEDYYLAHGAPQGQWIGSGLATLGVSGLVTEEQMAALYGEGMHPEAQRIIAQRLAAGDTQATAEKAARLGRKYATYPADRLGIAGAIAEELARFVRVNHHDPTPHEAQALRTKAVAVAFHAHYGRGATDMEELKKFQAAQTTKRDAVAGYDLTFSPVKSVSVLWAVGGSQAREAIQDAHEAAIRDTVKWLENEAIATRTGKAGIAQVDVTGIIASKFRHYESRTGDPQLHDHLVIANRVYDAVGKRWLTIDGTLLHHQIVTASEHYNRRIMAEVCTRLGVTTVEREPVPGKQKIIEIAGIPQELIDAMSTRSMDIQAESKRLTQAFLARTGRQPDHTEAWKIKQAATLATRTTKEGHRSLADLVEEWSHRAETIMGAPATKNLLRDAQRHAQAQPTTEALNVDEVAQDIIEALATKKSTWSRTHVVAEVNRYAATHRALDPWAPQTIDAVTVAALKASTCLTPTLDTPRFAPLERASGESIYQHRGTHKFTSQAVLRAEDALVKAAQTVTIPAVSTEVFDTVAAAHTGPLSDSQRELARAFACSDRLLVAGIGPAGSGKTTALSVAAAAVRAQGGRVLGLATSAAAAKVLGDEINAPAHTLSKFLHDRSAHSPATLATEFSLRQGDVVIVDEAGMVSTSHLHAVMVAARDAGAHVRVVGDDHQLQAVEGGGGLRLIVAEAGAARLEDVHRFRSPGEAAASLNFRDGTNIFAWYERQDRVMGGDRDVVLAAMLGAWQRDRDAGSSSLMLVDTNDAAVALNREAQAYEIARGNVRFEGATVHTMSGLRIGVGDLIVTRKNERQLVTLGGKDFVKNGDHWAVLGTTVRGEIVAQHVDHGGTAVLPRETVQRTELAYASTLHRAQGRTVDTAHTMLSAQSTREAAYVGMTRGRASNRAYVEVDDTSSLRDVLNHIEANSRITLSAHEQIRVDHEQVNSLAQHVRIFADVHERALTMRYTRILDKALPGIADMGAGTRAIITAAENRPILWSALRRAEEAGFSPARMIALTAARLPHDTDDLVGVIAARVDAHLNYAATRDVDAQGERKIRPMQDVSDTTLADMRARMLTRVSEQRESVKRLTAAHTMTPFEIVVDGRTKTVPGKNVVVEFAGGGTRSWAALDASAATQTVTVRVDGDLSPRDRSRIHHHITPRTVHTSTERYPSWIQREYGAFTRDTLAAAIHENRATWRAHVDGTERMSTDAAVAHATDLVAMREEQSLRRRMRRLDHDREELQRLTELYGPDPTNSVEYKEAQARRDAALVYRAGRRPFLEAVATAKSGGDRTAIGAAFAALKAFDDAHSPAASQVQDVRTQRARLDVDRAAHAQLFATLGDAGRTQRLKAIDHLRVSAETARELVAQVRAAAIRVDDEPWLRQHTVLIGEQRTARLEGTAEDDKFAEQALSEFTQRYVASRPDYAEYVQRLHDVDAALAAITTQIQDASDALRQRSLRLAREALVADRATIFTEQADAARTHAAWLRRHADLWEAENPRHGALAAVQTRAMRARFNANPSPTTLGVARQQALIAQAAEAQYEAAHAHAGPAGDAHRYREWDNALKTFEEREAALTASETRIAMATVHGIAPTPGAVQRAEALDADLATVLRGIDRDEIVLAGLTAEERHRTLIPDLPTHTPGVEAFGVPEWIAPTVGLDELIHPEWAQHVKRLHAGLQERHQALGFAVAMEQPAWAVRALGAYPNAAANPDTAATWRSVAAQLHTWRALHDHRDPTRALPKPVHRDEPAHTLAVVAATVKAQSAARRAARYNATRSMDPGLHDEYAAALAASRPGSYTRSTARPRIDSLGTQPPTAHTSTRDVPPSKEL